MNPSLVIGVSLGIATTAGLACALAHRWAKRRRWAYIPRYITGAVIVLIGYGFPLLVALPIVDALVLLFALILIYFGGAIGTFLAYDADPDPPTPSTTPDADRVLSKLDGEIGQK